MADQKNRSRPKAYCDASGSARYGRSIVLSTGRGDVKVTPAEARALAAELVAVANEQDSTPPPPRSPLAQSAALDAA